jgi:hypothetical protein
MERFGMARHFIFAFVIALAIYFTFYTGIEYRRTKNGPWRVTFTNEAKLPTLIVNEPRLNISGLTIRFTRTSLPATNGVMSFAQPQEVPFPVPFGDCIFEDTTFQPGTIVFKMFGHQIQLMPRVLTIDHKEYPWQSKQLISLAAQ